MGKENKLSLSQQLNVLRAGVLGANDGIVSVAGVVIGVAAADGSHSAILIAGLAAILAGAFSMAGGEYVSVSTQADTEKAAIKTQKEALENDFENERRAVVNYYLEKGIIKETAEEIANELMESSPLKTTIEIKYNLEEGEYTNPWHAAISSFIAFAIGSLLPFITMAFIPANYRIIGTIIAVTITLFLTGYISAYLGSARKGPAILRNVLVGFLTMGVTYGIGLLLHVN